MFYGKRLVSTISQVVSILRDYAYISKSSLLSARCYGSWLRQNSVHLIPRSNGTWPCIVQSESPKSDVIMARQKPPVLAYYGTEPFNFTISHNSVNTNSIANVLGLNDGKTCTLCIGTSALFPHWVLSKSHYVPNPNLGRALRSTSPGVQWHAITPIVSNYTV